MYTIHTKAYDGGTFNNRPAASFELEADKIICNDVMLPSEFDEYSSYNPYNVKLWLIISQVGCWTKPLCAIFASHVQDALDAACDAGMLESLQISDKEAAEYYAQCDNDSGTHPEGLEYTGLGNAGELHDIENVWVCEVDLAAPRDIKLVVKLARASEGGYDSLDF